MKIIVVRDEEGEPTKIFSVEESIAVEYMNGPQPPDVYDVTTDTAKVMTLRKQRIDQATVVQETRMYQYWPQTGTGSSARVRPTSRSPPPSAWPR